MSSGSESEPAGCTMAGAGGERPDKHCVRPYGDTTDDGMVQCSFTLPIPHDARAEAAALLIAEKMGMRPATVVHSRAMGPDFAYFMVYGRISHSVDLADIAIAEREFPLLSPAEVNQAVRSVLRRRMVVLGACIGTDAHTVGIDAILNIKGFAGEKGLEYYRELDVHNLGAQVEIDDLLSAAQTARADAILVSQVVTQRDVHLHNTRALSAAVDAHYGNGPRPLLIAGGPRFEAGSAPELGVDRIFSRGTTPREVASYLAHAIGLRSAA